MKLKFKATVALLLVLSMMIPMSVSVFAESNSDDDLIWQSMTEKTSAVFENADEMALENVKEVYDFAGNIFYVGECLPTGYFIYNPTTDIVVESSKSGVSPYHNVSGELYYGGPTYYYVLKNGIYTHTIEAQEVLTNDTVVALQENCEAAYQSILIKAATLDNGVSAVAVESGDKTIKHPEFFQNLSHCGYVSIGDGICGFIALGMIIAYNDKYINDNIMNDDYWENSAKTKLGSVSTYGEGVTANNVISKKLYDLDPKSSTTAIHIHDVCEKYLKEVGLSADHTSRVKPFFTESTVRKLIDKDVPVILFGSVPYQYKDGNCNHAVVAYGYSADKDSFIVHYGWEYSYYPDVKIDLGYFSLGSIYAFELE